MSSPKLEDFQKVELESEIIRLSNEFGITVADIRDFITAYMLDEE